jgi:TonB family protein
MELRMICPVRIVRAYSLAVAIALPAGAHSQGAAAPPQSPADGSGIEAAVSHLELARQHYANNRLAEAERELSDAIDRVRTARVTDRARPAARIGELLPRAGRDIPFPAFLKRTEPSYSLDAARQGARGQVVIDAVIGKNGKVRDARIARSIPALDRASLDAVRQWRFAPSMVNGAPADVAVTLVVAFTFRRESVPTDDLDLASFYVERGDYAAAAIALLRARETIAQESACFGGALPMGGTRIGTSIGSFEPPRKIKDAKPTYPSLAQQARISGTVVMEAVIDVDGRVKCPRVLKSAPLLDQAAIDAVTRWEFTPTLVDGAPVPTRITTQVGFSLR